MKIMKKVKTGLKIAYVTVILAGTLSGVAAGVANVKYSKYSTDDEIVARAEMLDADTSYLRKITDHFSILEHNGDEPIYVHLDDSLVEKEKNYAVEALDYVFGLLGQINKHYRYELVDEDTYKSKRNKTRIMYTADTKEDMYNSYAHTHSEINMLSIMTNKRLTKNNKICINREVLNEANEDYQKYVYVHELLHTIRYSDVYTSVKANTTKMYGNTIMNLRFAPYLKLLTPNDVKGLIALYADDSMSEQEMIHFLEKYTDEYYEAYSNAVIAAAKFTEPLDDTNFEFTSKMIHDVDSQTSYGYKYCVQVTDDKYSLKIYDRATNDLLDEASGNVVYKNGLAILRDVSLKVGMQPNILRKCYEGGWISDFAIGICDDYTCMYDILHNDPYVGKIVTLEKNMMQ